MEYSLDQIIQNFAIASELRETEENQNHSDKALFQIRLTPSNSKGEAWILENLPPTDGVVRKKKSGVAEFIYENDGSFTEKGRFRLWCGQKDFEIMVSAVDHLVKKTLASGPRLPQFQRGDFHLIPMTEAV